MAKSYGLNPLGDKADVERGDLPRFFPSDLLPFHNNYRFGSTDTSASVIASREAEIEAMVDSLCSEGQKQPILIHPVPGNRFQVHAGDTRHQAFLRIEQRGIWPWGKEEDGGRPRIECKVDTNGDPKRTFGTSITENIGRNTLNIIDIANAVAMATDEYKYTDAEILQKFQQAKADGTPKDPAWLPNMRRLARLPIEQKRKIYLKQMAASVGYILAEIPEERHAEVLAEAAGEPLPDPVARNRAYDGPMGIFEGIEDSNPESLPSDHDLYMAANADSANYRRESGDALDFRECPDCGPTTPTGAAGNICSGCNQPYDMDAVENPAPAEQTLDYSESQTAPVIKPNVPQKKRKKVTARAVAEVAKSKGLLTHKKVGHTLAGMREFFEPLAHERNAETRMGQFAAASLAWINSGDDDSYFSALKKLIKEK